MENIIEKICEIRRVNNEHRLVREQHEKLLTPFVRNMELIPAILERVIDLCNNSSQIRADKYPMQDHFVMVIMLLYCPKVFTGEMMSRGLREVIARALGVSPAHISNKVRRIWEWSGYYKDFRAGVWHMYNEMIGWLGANNDMEQA